MDSYEAARKSLAINIRTRRKALGLSQEALALEAEVNRTFVSQIERAIGNPSLHTLCRLASRLELSCSELLSPAPATISSLLTTQDHALPIEFDQSL
jgi:transcriptional regulator with XRE-family HTH domain